MRAQVLEAQLHLAVHLVVGAIGDQYPARVGQRLDPGRHVDAVPEDVPVSDDDVPDVDPDAELDLTVPRGIGFALRHRALDVGRAFHGIDGAGEFGQQSVSRTLHDSAVVPFDGGIDQLGPQGLLARQGVSLVRLHEPGEADHVEREDRGEPAFHPCLQGPAGGQGISVDA